MKLSCTTAPVSEGKRKQAADVMRMNVAETMRLRTRSSAFWLLISMSRYTLST